MRESGSNTPQFRVFGASFSAEFTIIFTIPSLSKSRSLKFWRFGIRVAALLLACRSRPANLPLQPTRAASWPGGRAAAEPPAYPHRSANLGAKLKGRAARPIRYTDEREALWSWMGARIA